MEAESSSGDSALQRAISDTTKEAIRAAVTPFNDVILLISFIDALEVHGFEPPNVHQIGKKLNGDYTPLGLDEVRLGSKDLFTILEHPIFDDMFAAASRSKKIQTVTLFDVGGDQLLATKRAWKEPYVGSAPRLLRKAVDQMNARRADNDYANFLPIIQSSGMGKSRTVDELARQVFTLPFNLRPAADKTGYPGGDLAIRDWLSSTRFDASWVCMRYRIFFEEVCKTVYGVVEKWPSYDSPEELASAFRNWLLKNREALYAEIYDKCEKTANARMPPSTGQSLLQTRTPSAAGPILTPMRPRTMQPRSASVSESVRTGELHAVPKSKSLSNSKGSPEWLAAQALIELIQRKSGVQSGATLASPNASKPVWLHIYFDEAHSLTSETPKAEDGQTRTCYQILCSVINRFRTLDLFVVFLSTNPRMSTYSPPQLFWSSSRVRDEKTWGVQTPFCELPFDQWDGARPLLSEGEHTLETACEPGFMVRFGRPLFWTRYKNGDDSVQANIVSFARMKLAGKHHDKLDDNGQLAVLGVRVGLSFDRSRAEARVTEDFLVEGHMRVAFSIPKHREYIYADALSEPILAEAAAQLMHMNEMWDEFPKVLFNWCHHGLIAKGERGELLARLLLTKAHDHVVRPISPEPQDPPKFTQPILLSDFLEALVGTKNKDKILNAKPNNVPDGLTLAESVLGKARLNFTHWAKASDSSVVTDEAAWIALARCLAWQCFDNQSEIDLVTPLMLPPKDAKLERYTVSAIFWQIKNRNQAPRVDIDAERLKFFSPYSADQKTSSSVTAEYANSRPYLTVVLNLGVQVAEPATSDPETAEPQPDKSRASNPRAPKARTSVSKSRSVKPRTSKSKPRTSKLGATGLDASEPGAPEQGSSNLTSQADVESQTKPTHPRYSISILGCSHTTFPPLITTLEEHKYASLLSPGDYAAEHAGDDPEFQEAVARMKPTWKQDEGAMGSYHQFTRRQPTRLASALSPDQSSEAVKIHEYASNTEPGGEAENEPEDVMDTSEDEGGDDKSEDGMEI